MEIKKEFRIILFMLYVFIIPLICILMMKYIPFCGEGIFQMLLYGIEGASPTIAAILSVLHRDRIKGIKEFFYTSYKKSLSLKLCFIGFLTPAFVLTIAKLFTYLTPYHNQFITLPSSKKIIIISWALIAEELGWRGYLQNEIEKKWGSHITPLVIGLIWTAWHYHFFISGTMDVPIVLFTYGCIAESYGYYIITKLSKGNIVPASIWHFSGNVFFNLYLINPQWNAGSLVPYLITDIVMTVYIGIFIYYRKKIFRRVIW